MNLQLILSFILYGVVSLQRHEREYSLCEDAFGDWHAHKDIPRNEHILHEHCHKQIAKVHYLNDINQTGWAYLEMEIKDGRLEHWKQGYAAGFLEGKATRDLIGLHIRNTLSDYCYGAERYCSELADFVRENLKWMIIEIYKTPDDPYSKQVMLTVAQFKGLQDGYYKQKPNYNDYMNINIFDKTNDKERKRIDPLMLLQLFGDLEDLKEKFHKPTNLKHPFSGLGGHCSALVKLLPDKSDLLFSHITWVSYSSMLRMQKKYKFKTGDPGQEYSFSGYPGTISSIDDFILTSSKLAILETTIENHNEELNKLISPHRMLYWIRSQIAHRTASSAAEWANIFSMHNSGTYNNEWVIVDYKRFKKGKHQKQDSGLIYVLEQLPNRIVHADMTSELMNSTYWPSYNRPYFKQIQLDSSMQKMIDKYGDWYSYDKAPRARIFARDHKNVVDMDSMIKLMRSNDYTHDPFSRCDCNPPYSAESVIAARSDLNPKNGTFPIHDQGFLDMGATDVKVTNSHLIKSLQFTAIAGPTHDPTPVFDWSNDPYNGTVLHFGQPTRWTFGPVTHKWKSHSAHNLRYHN